jgi:hypothetical protein
VRAAEARRTRLGMIIVKVTHAGCQITATVSPAGDGFVSHAGSGLLARCP